MCCPGDVINNLDCYSKWMRVHDQQLDVSLDLDRLGNIFLSVGEYPFNPLHEGLKS